MHAWSAEQSALSLKHAIVFWQQPSALMHVLQVSFSNARPTFPRHVFAVDVDFDFDGVVEAGAWAPGSLGSSSPISCPAPVCVVHATTAARASEQGRVTRQSEDIEPLATFLLALVLSGLKANAAELERLGDQVWSTLETTLRGPTVPAASDPARKREGFVEENFRW